MHLAKFFAASENQAKIESLRAQYNIFEKAFDRGVAIDSALKVDDLTNIQGAVSV
jgi:hypothetical protein